MRCKSWACQQHNIVYIHIIQHTLFTLESILRLVCKTACGCTDGDIKQHTAGRKAHCKLCDNEAAHAPFPGLQFAANPRATAPARLSAGRGRRCTVNSSKSPWLLFASGGGGGVGWVGQEDKGVASCVHDITAQRLWNCTVLHWWRLHKQGERLTATLW